MGRFWLCCLPLALCACAADPAEKSNLTAGYASLDSHQYEDAISRADQQIKNRKDDEGTAEAFYLKGRAIEQRAKPQGPQAGGDLGEAAQCYQQALLLSPAPKLEGYIHTSLGNVDYWRDDYANALRQFSSAYDLLESPDLKSYVLYRAGICQQRAGQFDLADQTFSAVQSRFPGSDAARRAHEHMGYHGFMLRLATFINPQGAQKAAGQLRNEGVTPEVTTDKMGHSIVSLGPARTFSQAESMKVRFSGQYPDAVIVP